MTNREVVEKFINKKAGHTPKRIINTLFKYEGMTLKSNGLELINYQTRIAYHQDNKLYLNINKYSVTTSKIQSLIKKLANDKDLEIVEIKGEGY